MSWRRARIATAGAAADLDRGPEGARSPIWESSPGGQHRAARGNVALVVVDRPARPREPSQAVRRRGSRRRRAHRRRRGRARGAADLPRAQIHRRTATSPSSAARRWSRTCPDVVMRNRDGRRRPGARRSTGRRSAAVSRGGSRSAAAGASPRPTAKVGTPEGDIGDRPRRGASVRSARASRRCRSPRGCCRAAADLRCGRQGEAGILDALIEGRDFVDGALAFLAEALDGDRSAPRRWERPRPLSPPTRRIWDSGAKDVPRALKGQTAPLDGVARASRRGREAPSPRRSADERATPIFGPLAPPPPPGRLRSQGAAPISSSPGAPHEGARSPRRPARSPPPTAA